MRRFYHVPATGAATLILRTLRHLRARIRAMATPFDSPYRHGFARLAAAVPQVALADPATNAVRTLELAREAHESGAAVVVFPELGLSGYSAGDLFHQGALLDAVEEALTEVIAGSRELTPVLWVGAPLAFEHRLFNCAVAVHRGRVLAVVPKAHLPNYREFYEERHFQPASVAPDVVRIGGEEVQCGTDVILEASDVPGLAVHAEICEDLWVPTPPSSRAALSGATVLVNLSASNVTVAKADYRRTLCSSQSGRCLAAYVYAAAGEGESTTDLAWDGHAMIWEDGHMLAEGERFAREPRLVVADVDLERLSQERLRTNSFHEAAGQVEHEWHPQRRIRFELGQVAQARGLARTVRRFPFVPSGSERRDERCAEVVAIQVAGLARRLEAAGIEKVVIGVSGGLDSTQALLVAVAAMEHLGRPRENVLAVTMPGFATSSRTLEDARELMAALGVTASEIDIRPSCRQMLSDIGHPAASGEPVYDATYENVQAGERTSHLFRLANHKGGLVLGTGDLSELALGWDDLRRGRPDVALQRQRLDPQDTDPPPDPVARRARWGADPSRADLDPRHGDLARARARSRGRGRAAGSANGGPGGSLRAPGLPPLLSDALRLSAEQGGLSGSLRVGRRFVRDLARGHTGRGSARLRPRHDQGLARRVPPPLLRLPIQAVGDAGRPQGGLRRLPLSPWRLAYAERRLGGGLAGRARVRRSGLTPSPPRSLSPIARDHDKRHGKR